MPAVLALLTALVLAVSACGDGGSTIETGDVGAVQPGDTATEAGTLIGVLGGDAQLEGGCIWLEPTGGRDADVGERVQPLLPEGHTVEFEPDLRILGPSGEVVAERGDELVVEGAPAEDVMSVCQTGPHYRVDAFLGTVGR